MGYLSAIARLAALTGRDRQEIRQSMSGREVYEQLRDRGVRIGREPREPPRDPPREPKDPEGSEPVDGRLS